jgi:hypothetical protein
MSNLFSGQFKGCQSQPKTDKKGSMKKIQIPFFSFIISLILEFHQSLAYNAVGKGQDLLILAQVTRFVLSDPAITIRRWCHKSVMSIVMGE